MIASGDLVLIEDPSLQTALIRFRERSRSVSERRTFADQMITDGYHSMSSKVDFLAWAPRVLGTTTPPDRWPWDQLADDVVFRSALYSITAPGLQNHRDALSSFADELELLRAAIESVAH